MSSASKVLCASSVILLLSACPTQPPPELVVRLELSPAHLMLTPERPTAKLQAHAFGATGAEVPGAIVTWTSSDPAAVRVDPDGTVTRLGQAGSAVVTAAASGVSSNRALVLAATPAAGAVLIEDAQVVGEPLAVDPPEALDVGWKYRVTLRNLAAPPVGAVLMTTGERPVSGRVVSVQAGADAIDVVLEVVPLDDLFEAMVLKVRVPLQAPPTASTSQGLTQVGPFECSTTIEPTLVSLSLPQANYTPRVDFVVDYDRAREPRDRLREFRVEGGLEVDAIAAITLNAAVSGELECLMEITSFPIPGALLPVFGVNVPVGVGFSMSLSSTIANIGAQLHLAESYAFNEGFACPQGPDSCAMVHAPGQQVSGKIEPIGNHPLEGYRAEFAMYGFAFAKLSFGVPWLKTLRFDAIEAKAGLRGAIDAAPRSRQIAEKNYHSGVTLTLHGEAEAASSVERMKKLLNVKFLSATATVDVVLDQVPQGTFTAAPTTVEPGAKTTLTVDLEGSTRTIAEKVEIVRVEGATLTTACSIPRTASGQTRYSCQVTLPTQGPYVFHAFVDTSKDDSGLTMELGDHSPVTVQAGVNFTTLTRVNLRFGPVNRSITSTGTHCSGTVNFESGFYFLYGENGTWNGTTFTGGWDRTFPVGSFGGHRRETANFTLTLDPTASLMVGFEVTHVLIGYADDPEGNTTREQTHLRWVGPSLPSVKSVIGQVDFETNVALTPTVLLFESTRTHTYDDCVEALTAWSADPDPTLAMIRLGLSQ